MSALGRRGQSIRRRAGGVAAGEAIALMVKVACPDISSLEETTGFLAGFGTTTTSVVFSTPIIDAPVTTDMLPGHHRQPVEY